MAKKKKIEAMHINAPLAYVQAIEALNIAKKFALERKDHPTLVDIANSWIEIGSHMLTAEVELVYDDEEAHTVHAEEEQMIGFGFVGGSNGEEETQPSAEPVED